MRKAVSLGGDADTLGAISGSIAEAFYGEVPAEIIEEVRRRMPAKLWSVIEQFSSKFAGQTRQPRTGA